MELVRYQADGISAFTGQLVARPYRKTAAGAVVSTDEAQSTTPPAPVADLSLHRDCKPYVRTV